MDKSILKKAFEVLEPTEKQEEKMFDFIMNEGRCRRGRNKIFYNKWSKRLVPVFICLIMIISITAYAVNSKHQEFSNKIYQWSISEEASDIDISTSSNGYTITANSVYGDNQNIYVVFTLSRDDGKKLKVQEEEGRTSFGFRKIEQYVGEDPSEGILGSMSFYALYDDNLNDNKVQFMVKYGKTRNRDSKEHLENINGKDLHVKFEKINLGFMDLFNKGTWELTVPLDYKDIGREYDVNQEFLYAGGVARLDAIYCSPLDITLYFSSDDGSLEDLTLRDFEEDEYIKIKLSNGNYVLQGAGGAGGDNEGRHVYKHISLLENGPIKPEDISAIIIGDVEIPVSSLHPSPY